jgi:hypothetical protein
LVAALGLIGAVAVVVGLVGAPLYGDGGWYFVRIVLTGEPLIPNQRVSAAIAQVPVLLAWRFSDDVLVLRHAFSLGYALLPWAALAIAWWLVRRRAPWLWAYPVLGLVALQLNFSGVSELVVTLHLSWPFVLAALLYPERIATLAYGLVLAAVLVFLHPLSFTAAALLALLAVVISRRGAALDARRWYWLAGWFTAAGVVRLAWTVTGLTSYERGRLAPEAAGHYLLPATDLQLGFLIGIALLGLGWTLLVVAPRQPWRGRLAALLGPVAWLLPLAALGIGAGFLIGEGIRLKVGLSFMLGLGLMVLAAIAVLASERRSTPLASPVRGRVLRQLIGAATAAILLLAAARSVAWWTATHGLANLTASSTKTCIPFGPDEPYAMQWPWMAIIDDWAAPFNAMVFRGDPGLGPIALLLKHDGCTQLAETGIVHFPGWVSVPFPALEARFGPLRR